VRVLILHNPVSADSAPDDLDTLAQVEAVREGLTALAHEVAAMDYEPSEPMARKVRSAEPQIAFNLVESVSGSARRAHEAAALLEEMGVAFTGAASEPFRLSTNKLTAKSILFRAGVPTPEWRITDGPEGDKAPLFGPWLIKSVWEHASLGLEESSVVSPVTMAELRREMRARSPFLGGDCFAEAYVHGREFNISLLETLDGLRVLPIAELRFVDWDPQTPRIVGYAAKWQEDSPQYRSTVRSFDYPPEDGPLLDTLAATAVDAWKALRLSGYGRIDLRVDDSGHPLVIDVNANPCISPDAGFQAAARQAGLGFTDVLEHILNSALGAFQARSGEEDCAHGPK
jgi:D-alanine-D-alanine ligase